MTEELPFCECGCGESVTKKGNRFIHGHNNKGVQLPPRTPEHCAAISVGRKNSDAVKSAAKARRCVPHTPEACARMSVSHTGVPLSPEHCNAVSEALTDVPRSPEACAAIRNSDAHKAHTEEMIGGNDILKHHHIYDHDDLSKYTIEMTRSQHMSLHRNMQFLGLKIPHINTGHENEEELQLMEYLKKIESEPKGL